MTAPSAGVLARRALVIVLAIGVGIAGIVLGTRLRDRVSPPIAEEGMHTPPSRLATGNPFPDVALVGEDGAATTTHELLRSQGGVVIFIEIGCPPCSVMVSRWQRARDEGQTGVPAFAIAAASLESIQAYKQSRGFSFPIYSDPPGTFERAYEVTGTPLRLVVGRSLTVRAHSFDANEPVDPGRLAALLKE